MDPLNSKNDGIHPETTLEFSMNQPIESDMRCPRCQRALLPRAVHDVEVNGCDGCGGLFVRRGELNRVAEPTDGDLEFSTLDHESFQHEDLNPPTDCLECPGSRMHKVEFNIYTGIILDHCERCGGFWLDGPELERINAEVRRLNEQSADQRSPAMLWFAQFIWNLPR